MRPVHPAIEELRVKHRLAILVLMSRKLCWIFREWWKYPNIKRTFEYFGRRPNNVFTDVVNYRTCDYGVHDSLQSGIDPLMSSVSNILKLFDARCLR